MGPRVSSWSSFLEDRNSKISIAGQSREEAGPAQMRDKRPHIPHSGSQGDPPDYTGAEKLLGGQKGSGRHPIVSDVNSP